MDYQYLIYAQAEREAFKRNANVKGMIVNEWSNASEGGSSSAWADVIVGAFETFGTVYQAEADKKVAELGVQSAQATADQDTIINISNAPTASITNSTSTMTWVIAGGAILVVGIIAVVIATRKR